MAPPTHDELLSLRTLGTAKLSPDGSQVLYSVSSTDWEKNGYTTQLWLAAADQGSPPRAMTTDPKGASAPDWSPDGAHITFIGRRGGGDDAKPQVYALPLAGGEPVQLSAAERGVGGYNLSPDGATLAFTAREPETEEWKERKETFGDFMVTSTPHRDTAAEHTHIFTLDAGAAFSGEPQEGVQRTSGRDFTCSQWDMGSALRWSPDSSRLAFVGTATPDLTSSPTATVYVLSNLAGDGEGTVTPLIEQDEADGSPVWSPCGEFIAYSSQLGRAVPGSATPERNNNALNSVLCVLPAAGAAASGAEPVELSHAFDEDPQLLAWTTAGLLFGGQQKTENHLWRLAVDTADLSAAPAPIERLTPDGAMMTAFDVGAGGGWCAVAASATALPEVVVSTRDGALTTLTDMTEQASEWDPLGGREVISWESEDGQEIEGILITPAGFDKSDTSTKHPLFCIIHGGPTGTDIPALPDRNYYPVEEWLAAGAIVLKVSTVASTLSLHLIY